MRATAAAKVRGSTACTRVASTAGSTSRPTRTRATAVATSFTESIARRPEEPRPFVETVRAVRGPSAAVAVGALESLCMRMP